ncbi:MAG: T9SS type A sorting domain-containing protein [Chloroflexota bacterium]|nr:T9SS type A sorting domain-containing protein [Lentimicrobium sp.]
MNTSNLNNRNEQITVEPLTTEAATFSPRIRFYFLTVILIAIYVAIGATVFGSTIYIDPSYTGSTQTGSMSNPYNSWKKFTINSGNAYLQKAGTTYTSTSTITINGKTGVTLGMYGTGNKPKIVTSGTGQHILNVTSSSGVTVRDLEIYSTGTWISAVIIQGSNAGNNTIDNCVLRHTEWGVRVLTTSGGNKIMHTTVNDTRDDGIYIKDASSIEIGFCTIFDVNKKYLVNTDESYSSGDGVQIASTNNMVFNIHDNIIDHSSMGNKFCIIAWGNNYSGTIERNTLIGARTKNNSGIYFSPTTKTVCVRYNIIKTGEYGIYNYAKLDAYYNVFSANNTAIQTMSGYTVNARNNVFYNNYNYGVSSASSTTTTLKNNIFNLGSTSQKAIKTSSSVSSNNNVFNTQHSGFINSYSTLTAWRSASGNDGSSVVGNPAFVNPSNQDFHLQSGSAAINKGANVSLTKDYYGALVPVAGYPDAGVSEFNSNKMDEITQGDSLGSEAAKEMLVFPNPSIDGKFSIKLGKLYEQTNVEVYDMLGRLVKKTTATMTAEPILDMSTMPNGGYLIRVDTGSEKKTLKAIKNTL